MKKILALILTAVMLCSLITSCSAYKNYDKYIKIDDLKKVELSEAKILKKVADAILDIRESSREELYVELKGDDVVSKKGDKLNIDFNYKSHNDPSNPDLKLSEDTLKGMKGEKQDLVLGSGTFVGAYTDEKKKMLFCALKESESVEFHRKILEIDNEAFIVFAESQRIKGNGFRLYK